MYVKALDSAVRSAFKEFVACRAIIKPIAARAVEVPLAHLLPDLVQRGVLSNRARAATTLPFFCVARLVTRAPVALVCPSEMPWLVFPLVFQLFVILNKMSRISGLPIDAPNVRVHVDDVLTASLIHHCRLCTEPLGTGLPQLGT